MRPALAIRLVVATILTTPLAGHADPTPARLKVAIVQMALAPTLAANRDHIVSGIPKAAALGARVVVFPEGALRGEGNDRPAEVEQAVLEISEAARGSQVHVLFGGASYSARSRRDVYWLRAIGPDGREEFRYDKLYDKHDAAMPGVFRIDGIPCSAFLCADRWLRGVEEIPIHQGARISFELSCNFASEWVEPFQWYWNVPRALRNNVWVVFANTGNKISGVSDTSLPRDLRHGHSAVIAPDGKIAAAANGDAETIVVFDIDVAAATAAEARARAENPVLRRFWEAGVKIQSGQPIEAPPLARLESAVAQNITLAAAQVTGDPDRIVSAIAEAAGKGADLVAFPERAMAPASLERVRGAARQHRVTVVIGAEMAGADGPRNSAFVVGPEGTILTRYDQLSGRAPHIPGNDPAAMWFRVKGVPAVVTIGRDALWVEIAELAAVAGAQIHVHLDHDDSGGAEGNLRRLQLWSNLASFRTLSVTANSSGSAIWEDLRGDEESRAVSKQLPAPDPGTVEVYSPFSANLVVRAKDGERLILATRQVNRINPHHPGRTSHFNPQMDPWYRIGAAIIHPTSAP